MVGEQAWPRSDADTAPAPMVQTSAAHGALPTGTPPLMGGRCAWAHFGDRPFGRAGSSAFSRTCGSNSPLPARLAGWLAEPLLGASAEALPCRRSLQPPGASSHTHIMAAAPRLQCVASAQPEGNRCLSTVRYREYCAKVSQGLRSAMAATGRAPVLAHPHLMPTRCAVGRAATMCCNGLPPAGPHPSSHTQTTPQHPRSATPRGGSASRAAGAACPSPASADLIARRCLG